MVVTKTLYQLSFKLKQQLQSVSKFGKQFNELLERVNSVSIELKN